MPVVAVVVVAILVAAASVTVRRSATGGDHD
jgi:hypothetical protein